ncbi:MAG: HDIG domain-containing protein [Phycisphaerae bacterium]|nr:HDIG domain-containing protein [Phycisphaerae bacterium]
MAKKKTKRVGTRKAQEQQWAQKRQAFLDSGAVGSLLLLLGFVLLASLVLVFGHSETATQDPGHWEFSSPGHYFVTCAIMIVMSGAMGLYVYANEPSVVKKHGQGFLFLFILIFMVAFVRLCLLMGWSLYLTIMPTMILGIMMAIAYNQRFALGISSFLVLISILAMADFKDISFGQGFGVLFSAGLAAALVILMLGRIRKFTKLLEACSLAAVVMFLLIFMVGIWQSRGHEPDFKQILINCLWGSGSALSVGFLMQGLLPLVEKLFRTATDMTLMAYGESTQPLLKRLAVEAPGTFNHSWQIGMLAESAAEAIGANGLLCRVGSYYHDVGKMNKPRYFIENQAESFNQHRELSPTMSRMIIIGHVKDGLELLDEYNIPKVLWQFTETHHGTTLVAYFFHAATKKAQEADQNERVEETEFRYPGPKPYTKESAIVMLADVVEGATRAMSEPTPSRIEQLVHQLVNMRLQDGQLDDSDITMKELHIIEKSLVKSLCAMYHGRIAYPKSDKEKEKEKRENDNGAKNP